ncbi:hypothetical protein VN24_21780 [Paenibacillus beijingensis]|uniref:Diacylglycerol glucosyltransferase n=2 Tax=Paenibacillus beijingensis TaxID=1126833 RepID=A0A0D5NRZ4_9BACL|nr:hypothetical protein VN24_21780 [Paenibacillus beijingensis]
MYRDPKIIILYASYGDGHLQVAKALKRRLELTGCRQVQMIDLMAAAHPVLDALTKFTYLKCSVFFPSLYGWSYQLSNKPGMAGWLTSRLHSLCIRAMRQIVKREMPDAVIQTYPMLAMSELRGRSGAAVPTFTVVTDFVYHGNWIHPETDRYFVATSDLKAAMVQGGVRSERIEVTGIPIRDSFKYRVPNESIYARYNLQPSRSYVLIMAGAYGVFTNIKKMVHQLSAIEGTELLLVCGRNETLLRRMQTDCAPLPNVRVFGYVEQIQELMSVASCIVTKAGGVTLSESLAMLLPVIIYRPVPGQEKGNADYLRQEGSALIVNDLPALKESVATIVSQRSRNKQDPFAESAPATRAAERVVSEVLRFVRNRVSQQSDMTSFHRKERHTWHETYE